MKLGCDTGTKCVNPSTSIWCYFNLDYNATFVCIALTWLNINISRNSTKSKVHLIIIINTAIDTHTPSCMSAVVEIAL